jgi:hypothetical protein
VRRCSQKHRAAIHENSPKVKLPIFFDPDQWDPEYERYMRGVGQRMRAEGRDEQRKNEV